MNPFAGPIETMGPCPEFGTSRSCPHQDDTAFFPFQNAPKIPESAQARGSVLLVAGLPGHGKSVFGHRLLNSYQNDFTPVDLFSIGSVEGSPVRRHEVLLELSRSNGGLATSDLEDAQVDNGSWPGRLRSVLAGIGRELVVRLPTIKATDAGPDDIAWEIGHYARAAQRSKGVFIYEYLTDEWPGDWHQLSRLVARDHDVTVLQCVLDTLSPDDLWMYVDGVMNKRAPHQITLATEVPDDLRRSFRRRAYSLSEVHELMRDAFRIAIAEDSPEVTTGHLLSVAMAGGGAVV